MTAFEIAPSLTNRRTVTLISADYSLGGGTIKSCFMNSRSIKAGHIAAISNEDNGLVRAKFGVQNSTSTTTTNDSSQPAAKGEENIMNAASGRTALLEDHLSDEEEDLIDSAVEVLLTTFDKMEQQRPRLGTGNVVSNVNGIEWRRASNFEVPLKMETL